MCVWGVLRGQTYRGQRVGYQGVGVRKRGKRREEEKKKEKELEFKADPSPQG